MKCEHDSIFYLDLMQVDGLPLYTVRCEDCGEYGTIALVEDENTFGLTKKDIEEIKDNSV